MQLPTSVSPPGSPSCCAPCHDPARTAIPRRRAGRHALGYRAPVLPCAAAAWPLPCDGIAYAFANRERNRLKLLRWDGNGVWLCLRRLHSGRFRWPAPGDEVHRLTPQEWQWLVAGVDWQRLSAQAPADWRV
ncbi:IS66 family insertion sequence element accessory protein TnpB [Vogesella fluminis]|uniref:IS66 family insertion sequence element accessory protein TnpB n=1 Tax=Vogesella fluminis TaxID=1069161 RepID=UPI0036352E78